MREFTDASQLSTFGDWVTLVDGLKFPTYTTYDFKNRMLYVCDCDEILEYEISFESDWIKAVERGPIV